MKKLIVTALIASAVTFAAATWALGVDAQGKRKKDKWRMVDVGMIPSEFGDLVNFSGTTGNYALVFKNGEGVIHIVEFRGNKVAPKAYVMKRAYD